MIGQLYCCLQHNRAYDEAVAFPEGGAAAQAVAT